MSAPLYKVRTVTIGVQLTRDDKAAWRAVLGDAVAFLATAKARIAGLGLEVQTTRVVTNAFEDYMDCTSVDTVCDGADNVCARGTRGGRGRGGGGKAALGRE